jgi:hypothetical protein
MSKDTGGNAFPVLIDGVPPIETWGMTLRDYFAAKAMAAILKHGIDCETFDLDAEAAYQMADAMLAERAK